MRSRLGRRWRAPALDQLAGGVLQEQAGGPALVAGVTLIASGPLSYTTSADFSRYLPRASSPKAIVGWTALGSFLPSVIVCSLGAFAATAVDMTDPQTALEKILPGWFTPAFLLALVLGTIAINALTAYSAGMALQAVGVRVRRSLSVIVDGAVAVALTLYALLVSDFLGTVSDVLQLTVVLLGPSMAVYATDILLRRNRYDGLALTDETPGSPFWYTGGVNPAGALALAAGTGAAALCVNTLYTGPVAAALGGLDLALPVGMVVAAALYALLMRRPIRDGLGPGREETRPLTGPDTPPLLWHGTPWPVRGCIPGSSRRAAPRAPPRRGASRSA
ncbi:purine-cytosine permease family protein [Nonomuraea sp. NPDC003727]